MGMKKFRGDCLNGCGSKIFSSETDAKYCSLSCSNARFKKKRSPCLQCGNTVRLAKQKFCSHRCHNLYQFMLRIESIERGSYRVYNCNGFIRRYLVHKFGERCSRCAWKMRNQITGRVPVEVEHIDGNWENNHPDNLTLLCPNCHALTSTFRGLNRGRGRAHRLGGRENSLRSSEQRPNCQEAVE